MEIIGVEIKNFKSIKELYIPWSDLIVLYGPNGAGKSNIMRALNILFHDHPDSLVEYFRNEPTNPEFSIYLRLEDTETKDWEFTFYRKELLEMESEEEDGSPGIWGISDSEFEDLFNKKVLQRELIGTRPQEYWNSWQILFEELLKLNYFRVVFRKGSARRQDSRWGDFLKLHYFRVVDRKDLRNDNLDYPVIGEVCLPPLAESEGLKRAVTEICENEETIGTKSSAIPDGILERLKTRGLSRDNAPLPVHRVNGFEMGYGGGLSFYESPYLISLQPGTSDENIATQIRSAIEERVRTFEAFLENLGLGRKPKDEIWFEIQGRAAKRKNGSARLSPSVRHYCEKLQGAANEHFARYEIFDKEHSLVFSLGTSEDQSIKIDAEIEEPGLSFPIPLSDASSSLRTWGTLSILESIKDFRTYTRYFGYLIEPLVEYGYGYVTQQEPDSDEQADKQEPEIEEDLVVPETLELKENDKATNEIQAASRKLKNRLEILRLISTSKELSTAFTGRNYHEIENWLEKLGGESGYSSRLPTILAVDEPELHLHPRLQNKFARNLEEKIRDENINIVIATHALDFLDLSPNRATFFKVQRLKGGPTTCEQFSPAELDKADEIAEAMGTTRGQLLQLTNGFIFVEGEHDVIFLRNLFGEELNAARVRVLPLLGSENVKAVVDAQILKDYTSAFAVVLLDGLDTSFAEKLRDRKSLSQVLNDIKRNPKDYSELQRELVNLMSIYHSELKVFGLKQKDIFYYLDEGIVHKHYPKFPSWKRTWEEYKNSKPPVLSSSEWKKFCCKQYGFPKPSDFINMISQEMQQSKKVDPEIKGVIVQILRERLGLDLTVDLNLTDI